MKIVYDLKLKLVKHLEENGIQTRNYFSGNILIHPPYRYLDSWQNYSNANEVLKRIFFSQHFFPFSKKVS